MPSNEEYAAVSNLQNDIIKKTAEIGAVPAGEWDKVSAYVMSVKVPAGKSAPLLPHAFLMNMSRLAVERLLVVAEMSPTKTTLLRWAGGVTGYLIADQISTERFPSKSDIDKSVTQLHVLAQNVDIFNTYKTEALGAAKAAKVTSDQQELKGKVEGNLQQSTFQDPGDAAMKGFMEELNRQIDLQKGFLGTTVGKLALGAGLVLGGYLLVTKLIK